MKVPQLHVGAGSRLGPLSIFPVWTSGSGSLGISTGTHADVAVTELASGAQVARLTVVRFSTPFRNARRGLLRCASALRMAKRTPWTLSGRRTD